MAPNPNLTLSLAAVYAVPVNLNRHADICARIQSVSPHMSRGVCETKGVGSVKRPMPAPAASRALVV